MTPVNGDIDQILRRALHAEVDSIEPGDGLERIHRRTHAPWLVRQASLMLTECVDLARLIVIRLEPGFTGLRTAIAERGGPWAALVGLLSSMVASIVDLFKPPSRRSAHGHRGPRSGSNLGWLRPALAVAGAVVIVVAGVYGLAQVRDNLVLELFPSGTPASNGPGSSGGQAPTLNGQTAPTGVVPTSTQTGSARPSPTASCSSTPKAQAAPTDTPTDSTATPTDTPTDSTATPTDTPTATPTDTPSTSAVSLGSSAIRTVAVVAPAGCRSASPSQSS